MSKIDQISTVARQLTASIHDPYQLAQVLMAKFNVGIYVDSPTEFSTGPSPSDHRTQRSSFGFQVWFKRSGQWVRSAGWININAANFARVAA